MTPEQAAALRQPFPPELVGQLPRAANKAAKEANKRGHCSECGKYHILPAVHLSYVGHAAVTDRLLTVDPEWTWEPMAVDERGAPVSITSGGLPEEPLGIWIWLTVCGVRRPGFGGGSNFKEAIGDALRNAAMRFGVGLDLWSKEDLHASDEPPPEPARAKPEQLAEIARLVEHLSFPTADLNRGMKSQYGTADPAALTVEQAGDLIVRLAAKAAKGVPADAQAGARESEPEGPQMGASTAPAPGPKQEAFPIPKGARPNPETGE